MVFYEFENALYGDRWVIYTGDLDFVFLKEAGFTPKEARVAGKAIRFIVEGSRERRNHQAAHYRTRAELEEVSGKDIVQRLIDTNVIELHRKWWRVLRVEQPEFDPWTRKTVYVLDKAVHKRHSQAPYRINPSRLHSLMHPEEF